MNKKQNLIAISKIAYETLKDERNKRRSEGINMPIGAIASKAIIDAYKKNKMWKTKPREMMEKVAIVSELEKLSQEECIYGK